MTFNKPLVLALCLAATGCAQSPQQSSADGGHWWSFGSSAAAPAQPAEKLAAAPAPVAPTASADSADGSHWWWPFAAKADKPVIPVAAVTPMPDPKITQAWLDQYEPKMREAIKDSTLELERRDNVLVITAPVDSSFNPKRPAMLMPNTLGPFSRVAKVVGDDPNSAILILGHADTSGVAAQNQELSRDRAGSVAAIFRLSGMQGSRLMTKGMGGLMPRAANDSPQGRALNRRVEILLTPKNTMLALLDHYNQASPAVPTTLLAMEDAPAKPPVAAATDKKAVAKKAVPSKPTTAAAKKSAATKAANAKLAADKAAAAKKPVAKKAAPSDDSQAPAAS